MVIAKTLFQDNYYIEKNTKLLEKLDIHTENFENYLLAFVHRSLVNERPDFSSRHNERLEFLGDAVLELVITQQLFEDFPKKPEGELTDLRSAIVKGSNLAKVARDLEFQEYLFLGKGEELGGGRNNDYLLANCVEAFLGALYLDKGFEAAQIFVIKNIYSKLPEIIASIGLKDAKSLLQEFTQSKFGITPEYKVLEESGLDHDKTYISGVFLAELCIGQGSGSSKKKSQEAAAQDAYSKKENIQITK